MAKEKYRNKPLVDFMLDLETFSMESDACIISISCIKFNRYSPKTSYTDDETFYVTIDATSCGMLGMHFDMDTVNWWKQQSANARKDFFQRENIHICKALPMLTEFINKWCDTLEGDACIWVQGQDFDIPILRNAYFSMFEHEGKIPRSKWRDYLPWSYTNVRDARTTTKLLASIYFDRPNIPARDTDELIAEDEKRLGLRKDGKFTDDWNAHNALGDCIHSAYCVSYLFRAISSVYMTFKAEHPRQEEKL